MPQRVSLDLPGDVVFSSPTPPLAGVLPLCGASWRGESRGSWSGALDEITGKFVDKWCQRGTVKGGISNAICSLFLALTCQDLSPCPQSTSNKSQSAELIVINNPVMPRLRCERMDFTFILICRCFIQFSE